MVDPKAICLNFQNEIIIENLKCMILFNITQNKALIVEYQTIVQQNSRIDL